METRYKGHSSQGTETMKKTGGIKEMGFTGSLDTEIEGDGRDQEKAMLSLRY